MFRVRLYLLVVGVVVPPASYFRLPPPPPPPFLPTPPLPLPLPPTPEPELVPGALPAAARRGAVWVLPAQCCAAAAASPTLNMTSKGVAALSHGLLRFDSRCSMSSCPSHRTWFTLKLAAIVMRRVRRSCAGFSPAAKTPLASDATDHAGLPGAGKRVATWGFAPSFERSHE